MELRRRALLISGVSATTLGLPGVVGAQTPAGAGRNVADQTSQQTRDGGAPSVGVDELIALSAAVTGREASAFDKDMAQQILQGLQAQGRLPQLAALHADPQAEPALANALRVAWYSGTLPGSPQPQFVGFQGALLWSAVPFLHVPAQCGGATGYWSEPPAA